MGIRNKISPGYAYYLTITVVEWIDVLSRPVYKHLMVDSIPECSAIFNALFSLVLTIKAWLAFFIVCGYFSLVIQQALIFSLLNYSGGYLFR